MSNEKPVELTDSEKADLIDAFQDGYLMSTDPMTSDLTQLGIVVTRIKATARREALLEAIRRITADQAAEIARRGGMGQVRASIALNNWVAGMGIAARHVDDVRRDRPARTDHRPNETQVTRALAEPERDEESGR